VYIACCWKRRSMLVVLPTYTILEVGLCTITYIATLLSFLCRFGRGSRLVSSLFASAFTFFDPPSSCYFNLSFSRRRTRIDSLCVLSKSAICTALQVRRCRAICGKTL
jgi:hypothetical protein